MWAFFLCYRVRVVCKQTKKVSDIFPTGFKIRVIRVEGPFLDTITTDYTFVPTKTKIEIYYRTFTIFVFVGTYTCTIFVHGILFCLTSLTQCLPTRTHDEHVCNQT